MLQGLVALYYRLTLGQPWLVGLAILALLAGAGYGAQYFKLDASSDSLVLQNNQELRYYRKIRDRYGSDDFLIVTYTPKQGDLFTDATLSHLKSLRDELAGLDWAVGVTSILDVPLLQSPDISLQALSTDPPTLLDEDVDRALARKEFRTSPLYKNLVMNPEGTTTAILVTPERNEQAESLLERRNELRRKRAKSGLTEAEAEELARVSERYDTVKAELQAENDRRIEAVRGVLDDYRDRARIFLGGLPMITADMIDFVRDDLRTFGIGVVAFMILLLALSFGRLRWVLVPTAICGTVALAMIGFLGWMDWRVTVVSSNFISLVLIITLSLIVHLVVRHRELHQDDPEGAQASLLRGTVDSKFKPSIYTAATTMVSFASLTIADIRPVIDFGWMMVVGVAVAFAMTFIAFPAMLAPMSPGRTPPRRRDVTARINQAFAWLVENRPRALWLAFALLVVLGGLGMSRLTVENRFIDYFHEDTEIYQGMRLIDRELGGTTPLDVVLDPHSSYLERKRESEAENGGTSGLGPTGGYWYNSFQMDEVHAIHDYLDGLPETGKVLSLSTTMQIAQIVTDSRSLDTLSMALMYRMVPPELKQVLFDPYMTADGEQVRFAVRVIDSNPDLRRDAFLDKVRTDLVEKHDLEPQQINLTGMLVLYNDVMQSLFRSQYMSLLAVFGAIMLMFWGLFRSLKMAVIGPLPTLVAAVAVLGLMGWLSIPLDIMTITIAAITIGIGVHDTIHYTHRFEDEVKREGYAGAVRRCHVSVGRAMFYTTVIITLGFGILVLSNFMPTIYFGLFTGVAMVFALISNLALLPLLLMRLRPFD